MNIFYCFVEFIVHHLIQICTSQYGFLTGIPNLRQIDAATSAWITLLIFSVSPSAFLRASTDVLVVFSEHQRMQDIPSGSYCFVCLYDLILFQSFPLQQQLLSFHPVASHPLQKLRLKFCLFHRKDFMKFHLTALGHNLEIFPS